MTDTKIAALVERLRLYQGFADIHEAADALEALQAERDGIRLDLNDCNNERVIWKHRAEQAEAEGYDAIIEGHRMTLAEQDAEVERLRAFIIEEGMRSTIQTLNAEDRAEKAEAEIGRLREELEDAKASAKAAYHQGAIRALAEDAAVIKSERR